MTNDSSEPDIRDAEWYNERSEGDRRRRLIYTFIAIDVICTIAIVAVVVLTRG